MRQWVVAIVFVACKSAPPGPAAVPATSEPPGPTTPAHDPWAGSSDAGTAEPDAAPAAADMVTLYERGKFRTLPASRASAMDGCIATPDELAACKQIKPNAHCDLAPWYRAADVYCSGTPVGPTLPRPAEACGCTCSDAYIKAYDAWSKRNRACQNVP